MEFIEIDSLSKKKDGKKILENINITIGRGEICGIIGPNGAGKSTLMKCIGGIWKQSEGSIKYEGILDSRSIKVGALIEEASAYANMSAYENLCIINHLNNKNDKNGVIDLIEKVGLLEAGKKKFSKYSLGMKKKLGIAIAMIGTPDLLILDEPTSGLDVEGVKEIRKILMEFVKESKTSLLICSHNTRDIAELCDRIYFIFNGKVTYQIKNEGFTDMEIEQIYFDLQKGEG